MKIALVILNADPKRGGAERYTVDLASALVKRGHDVTIVAGTLAPNNDPAVNQAHLEVAAFTRNGRYKKYLDLLDQHLAATRYDIVHAMLPVRRCDLYHPHAGCAKQTLEQMGWFKRLLNPRRGTMAKVESDLLLSDQKTAVLCLSEYVRGIFQTEYPQARVQDRMKLLFNGVDLTRFQRTGRDRATLRDQLKLPQDATIALMIANDYARKGLAEAIRVMTIVNDPKLALVVVGRQDATVYRRDAIKRRARVIFLEAVPDPRPLYEASDFFLLPTKHDPCSLVVLESLAMGLPVVSTKFNGATEIMTNGVHGRILSDPRNLPDLAAAIRDLLDPRKRAAMAQACLDLRPRLSYDHHLDQLIEMYQQFQSARS